MPKALPAQEVPPDIAQQAHDKLLAVERTLEYQKDPAAPMFGALAAFAGVLAEAVQEIRQAKQPEAVMTDRQVAQLGRQVAGASNAAARDLVRAANRKSAAIQFATVLGAVIIGGLVTWLAFGKPAGTQCLAGDKGGVYCVYWLTKP